eukprot:3296140-Lingulodinium_polyedra.AAC.1
MGRAGGGIGASSRSSMRWPRTFAMRAASKLSMASLTGGGMTLCSPSVVIGPWTGAGSCVGPARCWA